MRTIAAVMMFGILALGLIIGIGVDLAWPHGMAAWIMQGPYYDILHDNPTVHCCGEQDCQPWPEADVEAAPDGYHLKSTGETIPYGKTYYTEPHALETSKFWRCHRWIALGKDTAASTYSMKPTELQTRCFFGPGGSS